MTKAQQTVFVQGLLIGATLQILATDFPDFKDKMLARLRQMVSDNADTNKAIASAISLIERL
jgi:hypothetical protein